MAHWKRKHKVHYLGNGGEQSDDEADVLVPDELPGGVESEGGLAQKTGKALGVHPAVNVDGSPRVQAFGCKKTWVWIPQKNYR